MSRHQAHKTWHGRQVVDELAARGILIRSPSLRGVAEEAPGAYKDVERGGRRGRRRRPGAQGGAAGAAGLHQGLARISHRAAVDPT